MGQAVNIYQESLEGLVTGKVRKGRGKRFLAFVLTFVLMFGLWIVLSGKFEPLLLVLGLISSALVAWTSAQLLFQQPDLGQYVKDSFRFTAYVPWLIYQIVLANFHVLKLVLHPRMMELIDPQLITFQTDLKKDISLVTMANSITLTPGTITASVTADGYFKVHAIDQACAEPLPGEMGERVKKIFER